MTDSPNISSNLVIKPLIKDLRDLTASEFLEPKALIKRCIGMFEIASTAASRYVGETEFAVALRLREMVEEGKISQGYAMSLLPDLQRADFSEEDCQLFGNMAGWEYGANLLVKAVRISWLVGAFIVASVSEDLIRTHLLHLPEKSPDPTARITGVGLVFVVQLVVFSDMGDKLESFVNWAVFAHIKKRLSAALERLDLICIRHSAALDDIMSRANLAARSNDPGAS
jgi:hypothetical protein